MDFKKKKWKLKKKMSLSTYDYFKQFKDYQYPYNEVENEQIREFLIEIADIMTVEREFAVQNKIKVPYMQIQGKNDGKVYIFHLYLNNREEFSQKTLPYIRKIPEILLDLLHLTIQNDSVLNLFPPDYFQRISQLTRLNLYSLKISELPNLDGCKNLNYLLIGDMPELKNLPHLDKLTNLEKLYIENVPKLRTIPPLAAHPTDLTKRLKQNVKTIENNLRKYQKLMLDRFGAPTAEKQVEFDFKMSNQRIESDLLTEENNYELDKLTHLKELSIINAPELQSIQTLDNLYRLQLLRIRNAPKLRTLPSFGSFITIHRLDLEKLGITALPDEFGRGSQFFLIECPNIQAIPPSWCNFSQIIIDDCINLRSLPQCLVEDKKYNPENTPVVEMCPQIHISYISGSPNLQISDEMRKRVKIKTPEDFKREEEEYFHPQPNSNNSNS